MSSIITGYNKVYRLLITSVAAMLVSVVALTPSHAADVKTLYDDSCATCHDSGALGAIKTGDSAKWQPLIKQKGMPALVDSVKNGLLQMPAGGLCDNCSDSDYRKLIEYMSK